MGLDVYPERGAITPENGRLRHLLYGRRRRIWRIICTIDEPNHVVTVLHIRHGAREAFSPDDDN